MNDLIQIVKVLDEGELKIVNDYVDTLNFDPSVVFNPDGGTRIDTSYRTSMNSYMDENSQATRILHDGMNAALVKYREEVIKICGTFAHYPVPGGFNTNSYREGVQILEYSRDQEYKFHHDAGNQSVKEYHRKITVITYLNNDFIGGETQFPHKSFKPEPGYALIFPSNWCYPHCGSKVEFGKKRVAVTWYYVEECL